MLNFHVISTVDYIQASHQFLIWRYSLRPDELFLYFCSAVLVHVRDVNFSGNPIISSAASFSEGAKILFSANLSNINPSFLF